MKHLYIIKAGSTFPATAAQHGDFEDMTLRGLEVDPALVALVEACRGEHLPAPRDCHGAVITGAHGMVTENLPWSLAIEHWVREMVSAQVPLLGICYGHQLLGRAMGGRVDYHPQGREVGTVDITLRPEALHDTLFRALPGQFPVHVTHSQSVLTLPSGAVLLAGNAYEPHHAMRVGRCAWGVQFHPEYTAAVTRDYVNAQAEDLIRSGQEVMPLLAGLRETPASAGLLSAFARIAVQ